MTGKLIWLMGASGSGKDSLLTELRQREQTQLLVAHRYITRDASAGSENHIALSEQEFFTRAGQNLLALSWHANGLYYGVGIEIDLWLHAGFDVVVNGSRAHLPEAPPPAAGAGALSIGAAAHLFTGFAGDPAPAPGKPWPRKRQ